MRTIDRASAFKRDYKREAKGQHRATLDSDLKPVLVALATDQPLDAKFREACPIEVYPNLASDRPARKRQNRAASRIV
jgi:hypothetical protein